MAAQGRTSDANAAKMSQQVVQMMEQLQLPPGASKAALARVLARLGGVTAHGSFIDGDPGSSSAPLKSAPVAAKQPPPAPVNSNIYSRKSSVHLPSQVRNASLQHRPSVSRAGASPLKFGPNGSIIAIEFGDHKFQESFMAEEMGGIGFQDGEVHAGGNMAMGNDMGRRLRRDMRDEIVQKDQLIASLRDQLSGLQRRWVETEAGFKEAREELRVLRDKNSKLRAATCRKSSRLDSMSLDTVNFETDPLALIHACATGKTDVRVTQLMKRLKNLEGMRDEAKAAAEEALASVQPLRDEIQQKEEIAEKACEEAESVKEQMRVETEARKETERQLRRLNEEKQRLQQELSSREEEIDEARTEAQNLRQSRSDLLGRTLKRDARIESLRRKLTEASARAEMEEKARAKAEDDLLHLEERMRIIRKKSQALQLRVDQDALDRQTLQNELHMKEEECCLLVSMLSGEPLRLFTPDEASAHEAPSGRGPEEDQDGNQRLIRQQQDRIKQLEMDVARLSTIAIAGGNEAEVLMMAGVLPPNQMLGQPFSHPLTPNAGAPNLLSPPPWPPHPGPGDNHGHASPHSKTGIPAIATATAAAAAWSTPPLPPEGKRTVNPFDASRDTHGHAHAHPHPHAHAHAHAPAAHSGGANTAHPTHGTSTSQSPKSSPTTFSHHAPQVDGATTFHGAWSVAHPQGSDEVHPTSSSRNGRRTKKADMSSSHMQHQHSHKKKHQHQHQQEEEEEDRDNDDGDDGGDDDDEGDIEDDVPVRTVNLTQKSPSPSTAQSRGKVESMF